MIVPVLHSLNSPENVGAIVRSHRAFGGAQLAFVGHERPWRFKKSTQAFSRRLERQLAIEYLADDNALFDWCSNLQLVTIALEIDRNAAPLNEFTFPNRSALICGNEGTGLTDATMKRCDVTVVVPQTGPVASLNVATACSIALYTHSLQCGTPQPIGDNKFIGEVRKEIDA